MFEFFIPIQMQQKFVNFLILPHECKVQLVQFLFGFHYLTTAHITRSAPLLSVKQNSLLGLQPTQETYQREEETLDCCFDYLD